MIKYSINQKDIKILNLYAPNSLKYIQRELIGQIESDNFTIEVENFNIFLSIDRSSTEKSVRVLKTWIKPDRHL